MSAEEKSQLRERITKVINCLQSDTWYMNSGWGQRPGMPPDAWTTAEIVYLHRMIKGLHYFSLKMEQLPEAIEFIVAQQHNNKDDGGWGLNHSSPPDTAFVLMVLSDEVGKYQQLIDEGLVYLANSKHYDRDLGRGGWAMVRGLESNVSVTSFIVYCLHHVQNKIGPNKIRLEHLEPARAFILERVNADGGWGETSADISDAKPTAYAILGLTSTFKNNRATLQAISQGKRWLKQNFNSAKGCWGVDNGDIESTAMAIWSLLSSGEPPTSNYITRAIQYLLKHSTSENELAGWGIYPGERIETWITFYVLMSFTKYLEVTDNLKNISLLQKIDMWLSNRRTSNILTAMLLISTIVLFAFSVSASDTNQETILGFSAAIGALMSIAQIVYRLLKAVCVKDFETTS